MSKPVLVKVGADLSDFQSSIGGMLGGLKDTLLGINPVVAGVVGVVVGIGAAAFQVASDFDAAFDKIQVGTNTAGDDLEGLKDSFRNVFGSVPEDADKVSTAIADVNTKLGLVGEPLEARSKQFLELSRITSEDLAGAIDAGSKALNAWGVEAEDQEAKLDSLYKISAATGVSVTDLASAAAEAAPTFQTLGLSFEESAALIGQLEKLGPGASGAISGLEKAIGKMTAAGVPATDALDSIIASVKSAPDDFSAAQVAGEIFGDKIGNEMAQNIRTGKLDLDSLMESIENSPTTIGGMADATASSAEKFDQLWNKVSLILEPLGSFLFDGLTAIADFILSNFDPALSLIQSGFGAALEFLQPLIDAFRDHLLPVLEGVATAYIGVYAIIWEKLGPALQWLWEKVLSPLVTFIRDSLVESFQLFAQGLGAVFSALQKIPGVSSVMEAGQKTLGTTVGVATAEVKKQAAEAGKTTAALKSNEAQTKKNVTATRNIAKELANAKTKTKETATETFNLEKSMKAAETAARDYDTKVKALTPSLQDVIDKSEDLKDTLPQIGVAAISMSNDIVLSALPPVKFHLDEARQKAGLVEGAFESLGLQSATALSSLATEAERNFRLIEGSGTASAREIDLAWIKMTEARKKALEQQGLDLPAEDAKTLAKLKSQIEGHKEAVVGIPGGVWTSMFSDMHGMSKTLSAGLADALFDGEGSFGKRMGGVLTSIGDDFKNKFTEPAKKAVEDLINLGFNKLFGVIDELVLSKLPGVGSAFSSTFGGGGGSGGGGGGGGIGGGGGGGIGGAINMVTGIATAISSIFGNVQMSGMNNKLDGIRANTLTTSLATFHTADVLLPHTNAVLNEHLPWLSAIGAADGPLWNIHDRLAQVNDLRLPEIKDAVSALPSQFASAVRDALTGMQVRLDGERVGEIVAPFVGDQLAAAGTLA